MEIAQLNEVLSVCPLFVCLSLKESVDITDRLEILQLREFTTHTHTQSKKN